MRETKIKIADRINFTKIEDEKFKLFKISINLITPLTEETACENALLSYLMKNGCTRYPDQTSLNRYLSLLYGAVLESDVRKNGDNQIISLTATSIADSYCISNEPMTLNLARLLCEVLLDPPLVDGKFPEDKVTLEKEMLKDAILSNINDKRGLAIENAVKLSCKNEPFCVSSLGEVKHLEKITPDTLKIRRESLLSESAIEIIACGNHFDDEITQIFKEAFLKISRKGNFTPESNHSPFLPLEYVNDKMDVTQTKLVLVFKTKTPISKENATALSVMNTLYGGGAYSKLFTNVREKMSLCYYCSSITERKKGILIAECGTQNEDTQKAQNAILQEFENIKSGIFTDEELNNTKKSLITSCKAVTDSVGGIISWNFSNKMSGNDKTLRERIDAIKNITRDDITKVAKLFDLSLVYSLSGGGEND